ncbi:MAG: NAD-dependent epimerase/dehydratase family protein [Elusimicrobiota bacterium]
MSIVLVTGSSGLIGSESCRFFHDKGFEIAGLDNDMRRYFFGEASSVAWKTDELKKNLKNFSHHAVDIRDENGVGKIFSRYGRDIALVIHAAAQPSHDWAAREPFTDFTINANGTLMLLEMTRRHCPEAVFLFMSTNKVYGDRPNLLPLVERETRWEVEPSHAWAVHGIDEAMSIDESKHSLFGASKAAADLLTQEYGRYFGMKTGVFRGGCLTGPAHSGAELHGFLAYLVRCALTGASYTIHGYKGKQVRDNIHSYDLVNAFWQFFRKPGSGKVYNMGGSRHSHCSVLEAISLIEDLSGRKIKWSLSNQARSGDHVWWVSDVRRFKRDYPEWDYRYDLRETLSEMIGAMRDRLGAART